MMESNKKLVSGMGKLNAQIKNQLSSWELDIELAMEDAEVSKAKGKIMGYLKALVHMGIIDLHEAREVYRFYTTK